MSPLKAIAIGLSPVLLLILIVSQLREIPRELKQPVPAYQLSYETLKTAVEQVELASKINYDEIDTSFTNPNSTPFGKTYRRKVHRPSGPKYVRTPLSVKGILSGDVPLVVLQDPSGKTHIVKQGETVLDRKIIKINSKGVTLRDKAGVETLMVE